MDTGKVEYAPDYKSEKTHLPSGWAEGDYGDFLDLSDEERAMVQVNLEHARLRDAVVEAARADLMSEIREEGDHGIDRMIAARRAYRAAVNALIAFESAHGLTK